MNVRFSEGGLVRLYGRRYIVVGYLDGYWHFAPNDPSDEHARPAKYTPQVVRTLARQMKITSEGLFEALTENVREALTRDFGTFTNVEKESAFKKHPFVKEIDDLQVLFRDKIKVVDDVIKRVNSDRDKVKDPYPEDGLPTRRQVIGWYVRWLSAGRDIRALVDFHSKKGDRKKGLQEWELIEIGLAIDETYSTEVRGSEAATWRRAKDRILLRAARDRLTPTAWDVNTKGQCRAKEVLGKNAIARVLGRREKHPLIANRFNKRKADNAIRNLGIGPPGDYSLSDWEVDHTPIDVIVRDDKRGVLLGRPYLTAIIDRYSRIICGYEIGFAPPSWVSVMGALRMAVMPKESCLAKLGGGFQFTWDVYGPCDRLHCDNGREFRSESMRATCAVLNITSVDIPRARGDLKGKIESWFRTQTKKLTHLLPGTTRSNVLDRAEYDSEGRAILSLSALKLIVTIWIVDVYNQDPHSVTGEPPAVRYLRGLEIGGQKLAPSEDLIAPMTGLVVRRTLQRSGVRYNNLRWNSNAFTALLNRVGPGANVMIRIDPLDLAKAYVLDEETFKWIEGDSMSETEVEQLTLAQYEHAKKELGDLSVYDEERGLKMAQASQRIIDIVNAHAPKDKIVARKDARFITEGRKPTEHVHQSRHDPDESERPLTAHVFSETGPKAAPPDARGPYRERVLPNPFFEPQFAPEPRETRGPSATAPTGGTAPLAPSLPLSGRHRPSTQKENT
jgi:putative transposase